MNKNENVYNLKIDGDKLFCGDVEASLNKQHTMNIGYYRMFRFDDFNLDIDRCDVDYDENWLPIACTLYDTSGKILLEQNYKNGKLVKEKNYDVLDDSYYHINLYDNNGIIVCREVYDINCEMVLREGCKDMNDKYTIKEILELRNEYLEKITKIMMECTIKDPQYGLGRDNEKSLWVLSFMEKATALYNSVDGDIKQIIKDVILEDNKLQSFVYGSKISHLVSMWDTQYKNEDYMIPRTEDGEAVEVIPTIAFIKNRLTEKQLKEFMITKIGDKFSHYKETYNNFCISNLAKEELNYIVKNTHGHIIAMSTPLKNRLKRIIEDSDLTDDYKHWYLRFNETM